MAAANFEMMSSTSGCSSSSDEQEGAQLSGTVGRAKAIGAKLDFSHRELDSDMFEIHLASFSETPER
jgi:hypothetical protein